MKETLLSLVIMISIFSQAQAQSVDTQQDLTALRAKAEKGDVLSQLEYGKAILDRSKEEASIWIQKAADQGSGEAWYLLGYAGLGKEKPLFYYKKSAEKGYPKAYQDLLDDLIFRAGASADIEEAKRFADLARKFGIKSYTLDSAFKTIDRCYEAGSATLPASDQPTPQEIDSFKTSKADCSSFQIAIGTKQDWVNYRKCLLSKDEEYKNNWQNGYNHDLAEIYANGWGVKRNPKLAMALVCRGSEVPAELEAMVDTLYSTKNEENLKKEFYFCDHITSGMSGTQCAAGEAAIKNKKRELELSNLTSQWTESQKIAFDALQKAAYDFISEWSFSGHDEGTATLSFDIQLEDSLKDEFIKNIKKFDSGELPKDDDFAKADKDLNVIYDKFLKAVKETSWIKKTQRKWIKYRDALVKFVEIRYPNHSAVLWKAWVTRQRVEQLTNPENPFAR